MGGNDSINVNRLVQKTTVKPAAKKPVAKQTAQKNAPTFWDKVKNYLHNVREVNSKQWADEAVSQSKLFKKT